jgi:hypothetical protein
MEDNNGSPGVILWVLGSVAVTVAGCAWWLL